MTFDEFESVINAFIHEGWLIHFYEQIEINIDPLSENNFAPLFEHDLTEALEVFVKLRFNYL